VPSHGGNGGATELVLLQGAARASMFRGDNADSESKTSGRASGLDAGSSGHLSMY